MSVHTEQNPAASDARIDGAPREKLRELSEKATPGRWRFVGRPGMMTAYIQSQHVRHPNANGSWADVASAVANNYDNEANAAFIVACVNYVRDALAGRSEATKASLPDDATGGEADRRDELEDLRSQLLREQLRASVLLESARAYLEAVDQGGGSIRERTTRRIDTYINLRNAIEEASK